MSEGGGAAGVARILRPPARWPRRGTLRARCGLMSVAAKALERRLCEPTGRLPPRELSALRDGRYAAAVAAVHGCAWRWRSRRCVPD